MTKYIKTYTFINVPSFKFRYTFTFNYLHGECKDKEVRKKLIDGIHW